MKYTVKNKKKKKAANKRKSKMKSSRLRHFYLYLYIVTPTYRNVELNMLQERLKENALEKLKSRMINMI